MLYINVQMEFLIIMVETNPACEKHVVLAEREQLCPRVELAFL